MTTRVEIMNDFLAINVKPGKTIQDIVEASGSALPFGCRDGECGTYTEDIMEDGIFLKYPPVHGGFNCIESHFISSLFQVIFQIVHECFKRVSFQFYSFQTLCDVHFTALLNGRDNIENRNCRAVSNLGGAGQHFLFTGPYCIKEIL